MFHISYSRLISILKGTEDIWEMKSHVKLPTPQMFFYRRKCEQITVLENVLPWLLNKWRDAGQTLSVVSGPFRIPVQAGLVSSSLRSFMFLPSTVDLSASLMTECSSSSGSAFALLSLGRDKARVTHKDCFIPPGHKSSGILPFKASSLLSSLSALELKLGTNESFSYQS